MQGQLSCKTIVVDGWLDTIETAEAHGFDVGWEDEDGSLSWIDGTEDAAIDYLKGLGFVVRQEGEEKC